MGTITRSTLRTDLKDRLGEAGYGYWTEARANTVLDRAHKHVAFDMGMIESTMDADVTNGTREYALPSRFTEMLGVQWEKEPIPLVESEWLDAHDPDWRDDTGDAAMIATVENGKLALYPTPNATAAALTKPLRIRTRRAPASFSDDSSTIDIPDHAIDALLLWAEQLAWRAYDKNQANEAKANYMVEAGKYRRKSLSPEGPRARRSALQVDRQTYRDNY